MNAPSATLPKTHARRLAPLLCAALFLLLGTGGAMAQTKLWEDTFNGGVVTGGYSQGATVAGPSSGNFSVSIPVGSTIRKAYLIGGRVGTATVTVTLNGTPYAFNGTNQVGPSFTTNYGGASGVHAIDVTADINPATTAYTIGVPLQPQTVSNRYPEFYLFIAFNNASLPGTTAALFCNTLNAAPSMPWTLTTSAPIINTSPVGLAIFGGYANLSGDRENVTVNGTLVGAFGGTDFNGSSAWGSMAGFQYYNNTLTGYNDDNADQAINNTDALSNIQALIPANTTSIPVLFTHVSGAQDNHVWAVVLTSSGTAVAPPPVTAIPVPSSFGDVVTGNGAPDAAGADSAADFDALQRSGYLAQNGHLTFLGYLKAGTGTVTLSNCTTSPGQPTVTCPSTTGLQPGMPISGTNIPPNATVVSVSAGSFVISGGATGLGSGLTLTAGKVVDATNFMGSWKHDGTSLKLLARQGDNAPETGATRAKFNILPLIPGISEGGQVTLLASLLQSSLSTPPTTADNDIGLWSELGGTGFQILMREDDEIPGLGGPKVGSLGFGCFATATTGAGTGEAAFVVGMKGSSTDTALLRTSVINSDTTAVGVIARQGAAAPGAGENFGGLDNTVTRAARMDAAGNVVFAAGLPSYKTGIWYQDQATKTVSKSVLTGEAAPGTTGATFQQLDLPNMGGGGTFAFRGVLNAVGDNADNSKNDGIWKATGTAAPALILRRGDSNTNRAGLFSATYTGTYANIKAGNIYNGWLTNANHGAWLGWVDLGGDGISAFPYDGNFTPTTDTFGIYTDTSGTMTLLIASGDAAPGIGGAKFFFIDHPICGGTEQVAFIATVNGGGVTPGTNDKGLWRTASNGGALSLALRTGDTMSVSLNGTPTTKTILDLDLPGSGYADHIWETPVMDGTGRLLVFVTFTDGSTTQVLVPSP